MLVQLGLGLLHLALQLGELGKLGLDLGQLPLQPGVLVQLGLGLLRLALQPGELGKLGLDLGQLALEPGVLIQLGLCLLRLALQPGELAELGLDLGHLLLEPGELAELGMDLGQLLLEPGELAELGLRFSLIPGVLVELGLRLLPEPRVLVELGLRLLPEPRVLVQLGLKFGLDLGHLLLEPGELGKLGLDLGQLALEPGVLVQLGLALVLQPLQCLDLFERLGVRRLERVQLSELGLDPWHLALELVQLLQPGLRLLLLRGLDARELLLRLASGQHHGLDRGHLLPERAQLRQLRLDLRAVNRQVMLGLARALRQLAPLGLQLSGVPPRGRLGLLHARLVLLHGVAALLHRLAVPRLPLGHLEPQVGRRRRGVALGPGLLQLGLDRRVLGLERLVREGQVMVAHLVIVQRLLRVRRPVRLCVRVLPRLLVPLLPPAGLVLDQQRGLGRALAGERLLRVHVPQQGVGGARG